MRCLCATRDIPAMTDAAPRDKAPPVLYKFPSSDELSSKLADFVIRIQNEALERRG